MNSFYNDAGARIRRIRELNRYTRDELAELANISPKFLYEIETGQKGFSAVPHSDRTDQQRRRGANPIHLCTA